MKTRKRFLVMVAVVGMVALFAASAHAGWHLCTVVQVGPGWGNTYVRLTPDGGGFPDNQWFRPRSDSVKEMLATALTAMANGEKVLINSTLAGDYPEIKAMYMGTPP